MLGRPSLPKPAPDSIEPENSTALPKGEAHANEAELAAIYDASPLMMCLVTADLRVERINRALADFLRERGWADQSHLFCATHSKGHVPRGLSLRQAVEETFSTGIAIRQRETRLDACDDELAQEAWLSLSTSLVRLRGEPRVIVCLEDITRRKQIEAQFVQAQKMEALGQLASSIAHQFNNILTAATMHLRLIQHDQQLDFQTATCLTDLERSVQHAATLTNQLLLFCRRKPLHPERVDLNALIEKLMTILPGLLGANIKTSFGKSDAATWVNGDAGMLEQLVMNLALNARDAIKSGGSLLIATRVVKVTRAEAETRRTVQPGRFVCVSVEDNGAGMDEATLNRIFEPLFTTKPMGRGTGLGLATVEMIVRQHQGWIEVESAIGAGTRFRCYLPSVRPPKTSQETASRPMNGSETILLVDDDENVRRVVKMTLRLFGYTVIDAVNGVDAVKMWADKKAVIELLITDMVMPEGIGGLDLARRLQDEQPSLPVIVTTGYAEDVPDLQQLPKGVRFLQKPFSPDTLMAAVRQSLDQVGRRD